MALSQYDEVKVLEEANVVDEIKQAFPNATVETIKSDDDKATDFPYGANEKKPNGKDKLNGHSGLNKDKLEFATQYLTEYESIGKIFKPDFNLVKLDERNYKDVITGCKIAMTQKFGN
jgi:hypothetical protein